MSTTTTRMIMIMMRGQRSIVASACLKSSPAALTLQCPPPQQQQSLQKWRTISTATNTTSFSSNFVVCPITKSSSSLLSPLYGSTTSLHTRSFSTTTTYESSSTDTINAAASTPPPTPPSPSSNEEKKASPPSQQKQSPQQQMKYMTRDGIPLKMPDMSMEGKFMDQQLQVRQEYQKANYQKALELSKQLYQQMVEHYDNTQYHPGIASALNNMALMHKSMGQWDLARQYYHQAMEIYEKVVGTDHASYAATLHNIALLNKQQVQLWNNQPQPQESQSSQQKSQEGETNTTTTQMSTSSTTTTNDATDETMTATDKTTDKTTVTDKTTTIDETTTATTKKQTPQELLEEAIQYLERAWRIREAELGADHPKTIESRSSLGSTIAYQIIFQHAQEIATKAREPLQPLLNKRPRKDGSSSSSSSEKAKVAKRTAQQWQVAEEHLREALKLATAKSSAARAAAEAKSPTSSGDESNDSSGVVVTKTTSTANSPTTTSPTTTASPPPPSPESISSSLAAATAAQNLAVYLKYRATTAKSASRAVNVLKQQKLFLLQAKDLYEQALMTRQALLKDEFHPQVISSKHSLAECLEALGEKERANELRMQMLDSYDQHLLKRQQEEEKQAQQQQKGKKKQPQQQQQQQKGKKKPK